MKIQLEHINPDTRSSFRVLHNPRLNDLFYWHFHPEFELVYIEGASGTRHVGDHISSYHGSDLVLIGSNIPHLNFDYGIKTDYNKEVLHLDRDIRAKLFTEFPEMIGLARLFDRAQHGIAFYGDTKEEVGGRLQKLHSLPPFTQFLTVLNIFDILARSEDYELLHPKPYINSYNEKQQARLREVYAFVDKHYKSKITLTEVASICNLEKAAFCRYFKKATGNTFVNFLNQYRISQAKRLLLMGQNISETCYDCGFESLSYFNRTFKRITSENPSEFKKRHFSLARDRH